MNPKAPQQSIASDRNNSSHLIAAYIRDSENGQPPERQTLLKQYPEFASELKQFFGQRDRLNRLVDPIREFGEDLYQSIGPGKQLSYVGNYELLEEVARGGMGVIYRARQSAP
jgi:eukaryotic-like serine/threonine-protein kinase